MSGCDVTPCASEVRRRTGSRFLVAFVGCLVGFSVAIVLVVVAFVVIALPSGDSSSIPGLVNLQQGPSDLSVSFGPLLVAGPFICAMVATPFVAAVLRKMADAPGSRRTTP